MTKHDYLAKYNPLLSTTLSHFSARYSNPRWYHWGVFEAKDSVSAVVTSASETNRLPRRKWASTEIDGSPRELCRDCKLDGKDFNAWQFLDFSLHSSWCVRWCVVMLQKCLTMIDPRGVFYLQSVVNEL